MAQSILKIRKAAILPGTLEASCLYMLPNADAQYADFYISNKTGTATRRLPTKGDIQSLITTALAGRDQALVVSDIAARNALGTPTVVTQCLVLDATADTTVASGAATYVWNPTTSLWYKISEAESMDVIVSWASITGKPTSAVAAIDLAVTNSHTHDNKTVIDLLTDTAGNLYYNGAPVRAYLEEENW